jgi:uncharacterized protein (TIGR03085 family)
MTRRGPGHCDASRAGRDSPRYLWAMTNVARSERHALCDTLSLLGDSVPTLCEGWTTRDLAAHLVMRESRPDGAAGVILPPLAAYAARVQAKIGAAPWEDLVDQVRSGPPRWSPLRWEVADRLANTVEFFIHHEDIRRAQTTWEPRPLEPALETELEAALRRIARLLCRKVGAGLTLAITGTDSHGVPRATGSVRMVTARKGSPSATLTGPPGELLLYLYGRTGVAAVEISGAPAAIAAVQSATFGI